MAMAMGMEMGMAGEVMRSIEEEDEQQLVEEEEGDACPLGEVGTCVCDEVGGVCVRLHEVAACVWEEEISAWDSGEVL